MTYLKPHLKQKRKSLNLPPLPLLLEAKAQKKVREKDVAHLKPLPHLPTMLISKEFKD
jgi:hypothetical protein